MKRYIQSYKQSITQVSAVDRFTLKRTCSLVFHSAGAASHRKKPD